MTEPEGECREIICIIHESDCCVTIPIHGVSQSDWKMHAPCCLGVVVANEQAFQVPAGMSPWNRDQEFATLVNSQNFSAGFLRYKVMARLCVRSIVPGCNRVRLRHGNDTDCISVIANTQFSWRFFMLA